MTASATDSDTATATATTAAADGTGANESMRAAAVSEVDPVIIAVIAAAVDQAWPRRPVTVAHDVERPPAWRFSGRWWMRPATSRRDRPQRSR